MPRLGERMVKFNGRRLEERGQALVEFAIGVPVLLLLLIGAVVFGVAFNNQIALTFATGTGAQQLSISRGQTSDPCKTTSAAVYAAAPYLTQSNLSFTIVLGGTSEVSGATSPSCSSAALVQGETAQVSVSYPCNLKVLNYNPAPSCALSAQTSVYIQ